MGRTLTINPDELGKEGSMLQAPGTYHVVVDKIVTDDEAEINNFFGLAVTFRVLAGEQTDKTIRILFRDGDERHRDRGEFANQKQAAFLAATNLATPAQLKTGSAEFEESNARDQQCVVDLELGKPNDSGKRFLDLRYTNIYHVDDPRAKALAKDKKVILADDAIKMIDASDRHTDEAYFEPILPKRRKAASQPKAKDSDFADLDI